MAKRRRRVRSAPDLPAVHCEAADCTDFPFYGVDIPAIPDRRVWLCTTHRKYWRLDSMRAETLRWQRELTERVEAAFAAWLEGQSLLVRVEASAGLSPRQGARWGARS